MSLARRPRHAVTLGVPAYLGRAAHAMLPGYEVLAARVVEAAMRRADPAPRTDGALYQPPQGPRAIDGGWRGETPPGRGAAVGVIGVAVAVGVGVAALLMARPVPSHRRNPAWRR